MKQFVFLITITFCQFVASIATAADYILPEWVNAIQGTYNSVIYSIGENRNAQTSFRIIAGGGISGDYWFNEPEKKVHGQLADCTVLEHLRLVCNWKDKYGSGELVITFDKSMKSFDGYWTVAGDSHKSGWSGVRE